MSLPKITNIISRTISNTQRIELLEAQFAALQKRFDALQLQRQQQEAQPKPVAAEPDAVSAESKIPALPPAIDPPRFTSGGTGTDLMEHQTAPGFVVYDANAVIGADSSGQVRFLLQGAPDWLAINAASGIVTMTRAIDLDAAGEAGRTVSFTVMAQDSADTSRTSQQRVSFTITNSDEQPASMTVAQSRANTTFSESADKTGGIELARVTFVDNDNPAPAGQSNGVTFSVSGTGHSLTARDFEFRNGGIFLKQDADTSVDADATVTVTVRPATSGHGTRPAQQSFTFTITNDAPPPPAQPAPPPVRSEALRIHENHPLTKAIIDLTGDGTFRMAPDSAAPDNGFFRVDAATGKIWFVPLDVNGDGQVDEGDYPLLDWEDPRDTDGNNQYDLRVIHTTPDGTEMLFNVAVAVANIAGEREVIEDGTQLTVVAERFAGEKIRPRMPEAVIQRLREDYPALSMDEASVIYNPFKMPASGPLILTWSFFGAKSFRHSDDPEERIDDPEQRIIDRLHVNSPVTRMGKPETSNQMNDMSDQRFVEHARARIEKIIWEIESFANIKFIEVADTHQTAGDFQIAVFHAQPGGIGAAGMFQRGVLTLFPTTRGSINTSDMVVRHEMGHMLGMHHPYDTDWVKEHADYPAALQQKIKEFEENGYIVTEVPVYEVNADIGSIMSYYHPYTLGRRADNLPFHAEDIKVLQFLYGRPGSDFAGLEGWLQDGVEGWIQDVAFQQASELL